MRKISGLAVIIGLGLMVSGAAARDNEDRKNDAVGRETFLYRCATCHAPGKSHPGTMRLAERLGDATSALDARDDLSADYVMAVVRGGRGMMPPFRPSEIDDETLAALAAYLSRDKTKK